ncbi:septum formation initiator [Streptomyces pathocidini]|uniref:Septum formation initiator n=1 Tax=Streptomyces pathocidini TaxID=1650571 RepID=A0ABW7UZ97_9ACTN|nr:hypothetical protein [Streptomyces pathocidini]
MKGAVRGRAARLARLVPTRSAPAARMPFVLLVVLLLGTGLITLLLLNSSLNQGSFRLSKLKKQTTELTDQQQALQEEVDGYSAPDALEKRARGLGMVPGGTPVFLYKDGTVRGVPSAAAEAPSSPKPSATASSDASPEAGPSEAGSSPSGSESDAKPADDQADGNPAGDDKPGSTDPSSTATGSPEPGSAEPTSSAPEPVL